MSRANQASTPFTNSFTQSSGGGVPPNPFSGPRFPTSSPPHTLKLSHLASPTATRKGRNVQQHERQTSTTTLPDNVHRENSHRGGQREEEVYVWSPSKSRGRNNTSAYTSSHYLPRASPAPASPAASIANIVRTLSPTRSYVHNSQMASSINSSKQTQQTHVTIGLATSSSLPSPSLLDSMSELRFLIQKKEEELSNLAALNRQSNLNASYTLKVSPLSQSISAPVSSGDVHLLKQYEIKIVALEQMLVEREEVSQEMSMKLRMKQKQEEEYYRNMNEMETNYKRQINELQAQLEDVHYSRNAMLVKQRDEFEAMRQEMLAELLNKDAEYKKQQHDLTNALGAYEETVRNTNLSSSDLQYTAKTLLHQKQLEIDALTQQVDAMRQQKAANKEQLNASIKSQLNHSQAMKSLQRRLEEVQMQYDEMAQEYGSYKQQIDRDRAALLQDFERRQEELVQQLTTVEQQILDQQRGHEIALERAGMDREQAVLSERQERQAMLEEWASKYHHLEQTWSARYSELQQSHDDLSRSVQSIQQELTDATEEHEGQIAGLTQEYTQKLQSTEEELARVSHELATAQNDLQAASEINEDRGREVEHTRTDIARAKERIEELSTRINELREHHKAELSAKSQEALERIDAAQSRLLLLEREMEEKERIYESEKVRVSELQQQLTLLQSSSNNKMRAAEVARTLEQQALLSDFAAQLNRVREEITQIKGVGSAEALARQKLLEKERQQAAELAEARRAAAAAQAAVASLESQSGIARKHVRVRSLGPNGAPASVYSSRPTTPPTPLSARTTTSGEQQPFASAMSSPVAKANQVFSQVYEKS